MAKAAAAKKPPTKSEILANVSAATNVPKKQVAAVLEAYAAEVRGIAVNRRADALFFLMAAHLGRRRSEADIRAGRRWEACRFQVHYADGETADVPVYAEIDLEEFRQATPVAVPGSQIAWTGPCGAAGVSLVAYCRQWNNPRPQVEIKSVDFLPGAERCATPALLALTAAVAAEPPR